MDNLILVAREGGFIGSHLVKDLIKNGHRNIRIVDIKPVDKWYQVFPRVESIPAIILWGLSLCRKHVMGVHSVYNLAADMDGMVYGFY